MSPIHANMYFDTEDAAQSAAVDLIALGARDVTVDSRAEEAFGVGSEATNAASANIATLGVFPAGHTSEPANASVPFLLGRYTMAFEDEQPMAVLSAVVEEDQREEAARIMRRHGGRLQGGTDEE